MSRYSLTCGASLKSEVVCRKVCNRMLPLRAFQENEPEAAGSEPHSNPILMGDIAGTFFMNCSPGGLRERSLGYLCR